MRRRLRRRSRSGILRWSRYFYFSLLGYIYWDLAFRWVSWILCGVMYYYINGIFC